jgi:dihydroneopterin aldolase|tara:strand:+ start:759 stop:1136 length:378 start_codon:yes stop_codon:yes gene_type:complete
MDKIFLNRLNIDAVIGIWEWERSVKQTVRIDLEIGTDARAVAITDSIKGALNYRDVAKRLISFVGSSAFFMVETLAESVAQIIITEFEVPWVKVSVSKPGAVRGSEDVGIMIERTLKDYPNGVVE